MLRQKAPTPVKRASPMPSLSPSPASLSLSLSLSSFSVLYNSPLLLSYRPSSFVVCECVYVCGSLSAYAGIFLLLLLLLLLLVSPERV